MTPATRARELEIKLYRDDGDKVLEDTDDGMTGNGAVAFASDDDERQRRLRVPEPARAATTSSARSSRPTWNQSLPNAGSADKADCSVDTDAWGAGTWFMMAGTDHLGNDFGNYQNGNEVGHQVRGHERQRRQEHR